MIQQSLTKWMFSEAGHVYKHCAFFSFFFYFFFSFPVLIVPNLWFCLSLNFRRRDIYVYVVLHYLSGRASVPVAFCVHGCTCVSVWMTVHTWTPSCVVNHVHQWSVIKPRLRWPPRPQLSHNAPFFSFYHQLVIMCFSERHVPHSPHANTHRDAHCLISKPNGSLFSVFQEHSIKQRAIKLLSAVRTATIMTAQQSTLKHFCFCHRMNQLHKHQKNTQKCWDYCE